MIKNTIYAALITLSITTSTLAAEKWADEFDDFSLDRWTPQTSGLQLVNMPPPDGVTARNGVLEIFEPLRGARLTSRDRFLYGTFEARVKITPKGLQYIGFMSRSPWAAHTLMCMSIPSGHGWELVTSNNMNGGHAGFGKAIEDGIWATIKITWRPERVTLDVNGKRIGELTDPMKIPNQPIPLILDAYASNRLEVDYIRISDTTVASSSASKLPTAPSEPDLVSIHSSHWNLDIDTNSGIATSIEQMFPQQQLWTPDNSAAVDIYARNLDSNETTYFHRERNTRNDGELQHGRNSRGFRLAPSDDAWKEKITTHITYELIENDLSIRAEFTSLQNINHPTEIGLGIPFIADQWQRNAIPRLPWFELDPRQNSDVRLPFLADPNDATLTSDEGSWVHYPWGIFQNNKSSVFWGSMDIGKRVVLAPGNNGAGPAITLAPKRWTAGESKTLSLRLRAFRPGTTEVVRWYLSNCISSDPLTNDLFPVSDWAPRTLPNGGGLGMPDIRISDVNPDVQEGYFQRVIEMLKQYHVTNLWFGTWHNIDGSYPHSGKWICPTGLNVTAEALKAEIQRLKGLGLKPCLYTYQFITPELLGPEQQIPSRDWVLHDTLGKLSMFDSFTAGETRSGAEWFTPELAERIGSNKVTWANVDYGRKEVRDFFFDSITKAIDYYRPSGICFDYGWGVIACNATYSPGNPATSQPHARLRLQADIREWIHEHHPEMIILINDNPGTPSQLMADCQLVESSDVMSDLDLEAGRALSSAMSSMDYYTDHDEVRWSRQVMSDLSRGCSIGMPFWIPINGPDDYVNTWQAFYDFSAKTTALPIVPQSDAITSDTSPNVTGTVWSDSQRLLAVAMDHRNQGPERAVELTIDLTELRQIKMKPVISRLDAHVQLVKKTEWEVVKYNRKSLILRGSLRPGELLMLELQ